MTPITMLNGIAARSLGCACSPSLGALPMQAELLANRTIALSGVRQFGAVSDYDFITIGGKQYSANQIVDKQIIASRDVTLYPSLFKDDGKFTVKAGQTIGTVFSYLLPSSKSNPTGKVVLQFERGYNNFYWLKDDNAVSQAALKDQGTLTVAQEVKIEQEKAEKESDPVGYYLKKFGLPALLIGGGIYLAATFGKQFLASKLK